MTTRTFRITHNNHETTTVQGDYIQDVGTGILICRKDDNATLAWFNPATTRSVETIEAPQPTPWEKYFTMPREYSITINTTNPGITADKVISAIKDWEGPRG